MLHRLGAMSKDQRGFTLVEVMVAIAITGLISGGVTMAISQVLNVNARSSPRLVALNQVEKATYWISLDARMAQTVQTSPGAGFPLNLTWVEWDNTVHQVSYSLDSGRLQRSQSINGGQPTTTVVARHIDTNSEMTSSELVDGALVFKVTASVGGLSAGETRTSRVALNPVP